MARGVVLTAPLCAACATTTPICRVASPPKQARALPYAPPSPSATPLPLPPGSPPSLAFLARRVHSLPPPARSVTSHLRARPHVPRQRRAELRPICARVHARPLRESAGPPPWQQRPPCPPCVLLIPPYPLRSPLPRAPPLQPSSLPSFRQMRVRECAARFFERRQGRLVSPCRYRLASLPCALPAMRPALLAPQPLPPARPPPPPCRGSAFATHPAPR
mmetsp:Transcript_25104/g.63732  ORF Transcript_25104/g.63732 Transcript_25104/m.63732 type:complete len:219 (-) Transcript_25104:1719-2375(-)